MNRTDELIRVEDAIKILCKKTCCPGPFCPDNYCVEMWEALYDVERVDAKPVIHAHLIYHDDEINGLTAECSNCHVEGMLYGDYCANCGAKLDEEDET